ncbi:APC family permease [Bailinhaonella thermotolerans]|uniref:APC family permease n=1 Tax=Bailinhaonella thermotolerans TaxID=1070861 RepID=UPI0024137114|nr:APC family permease [Bailinhaonella thermotolerans]
MDHAPSLARRLGLSDAVAIGLGSMVGAGVFAAFSPAAAAAGTWLLAGLAVAAFVAYCNAVASAQLAAVYPQSGGTYVYGRERLGRWWGFAAGWAFVTGKTASCAAMALTFASYVAPGFERPIAALAVVALTAVNYRGISKTARLTWVLLGLTLLSLCLVAGAGLGGGPVAPLTAGDADPYGVLQAAGLLFFAFAGYARVATLGEEVRDPARVIPRAIPLALGLAVAVYAVIGVSVLLALGPGRLAVSGAPLVETVEAAGWGWAGPAVRAGAAVACLGALLGLIAGIGRTTLAMAREGDLPRTLAAVHPVHRVPHHAEIALAVVVCALLFVTDLRGVIGFSSFGVLLYYAIANAAAFTQPPGQRRWPRALNAAGLAGCLLLAFTLPVGSVVAGAAVIAAGAGGRLAAGAWRSSRR